MHAVASRNHSFVSASPVEAVSIPDEASVFSLAGDVQLADAFAIDLPPGSSRDVMVLARWMLENPAPWASALLSLRDFLIKPFGIKTATQLRKAPGQRIGIFRVYFADEREVLVGEDDSHLDFRASVLVQTSDNDARVVVSTVVHCHNRLGRFYITVIAPFHRLVVKGMLKRAARAGWPQQLTTGASA